MTTFNIQITKCDDGLFLASAFNYIGGGNTVKGALDAWMDAIIDDAIESHDSSTTQGSVTPQSSAEENKTAHIA